MNYVFRISPWLLHGKLVLGARGEAGRNISDYCNVLGKDNRVYTGMVAVDGKRSVLMIQCVL